MGVGRVFHDADDASLPRHLVGGAVAGMTAAFGAPLAGLCFAFEEMRAPLTLPLLLFVMVTAGAAWAVVSLCFGFGLVFPFISVPWLDWQQIWLVLPVGLVAAVVGAGYNRGLIELALWEDSLSALPSSVRTLVPFLLSGILLYVFPDIVSGIGPGVMDFQDNGRPFWMLLLFCWASSFFPVSASLPVLPEGCSCPYCLWAACLGRVAVPCCCPAV